MTTKNIKQFIKEHNEFPLNKKISEPLDNKGAEIIFNEVNKFFDEPDSSGEGSVAYTLSVKRFYEKVKSELLSLGFKDHWENFKI